ncbi:MAG TPA: maleylpyruvate isomerase family mycothiol-dependent enzyme [Mycobacteriales bacterium]|nr:maleylpyruvate isomerase family mycothiol-dependent enzyme [Mycobacteriales bacterium]
MTPEDYLRHLRADAARLAEVAAPRLREPVPSCPEWDVAALVEHVAMVYQHKIACMRSGRPSEWPPETPGGDVVEWLSSSLDELVGELTTRGPDAPSYTWYPPDQTVGFWFRRMAQETAVHRVDAELAAGAGHVTPIDPALATDGIDELLVAFLGGDWSDEPVLAASGSTVAVRTTSSTPAGVADASWELALLPTAVPVSRGGSAADLTVAGDPHSLLLWLWGGRVGDDVVAIDGSRAVLAELRARLTLVTD